MGEQTVYVSIGNSDGRLSQQRWAAFYSEVDHAVRCYAQKVFGAWVSESTQPWQNACWAFVPNVAMVTPDAPRDALRRRLGAIAAKFGQDAITWAQAPVEMIGPAPDPPVPAMRVMLRPGDWEHIFHVKVMDPYGWRGSPDSRYMAGKGFDVPITEEEWHARSASSTLSHRPLEQSFRHNPWDPNCGRHLPGEPTHPKARCRTCNARPEDQPAPFAPVTV